MPAVMPRVREAGLEPATSSLSGMRSDLLSYTRIEHVVEESNLRIRFWRPDGYHCLTTHMKPLQGRIGFLGGASGWGGIRTRDGL